MIEAQGKIARLRRELAEALREIGLSGESQRTFDSALDRLLAANGGDVSAHQNAVVLHSADGANPAVGGEFELGTKVAHVDSFYEADKRVVGAPGSIINPSHEFLKNDAIEQGVSVCFQYGSGNHSPQVPDDRVAELEAECARLRGLLAQLVEEVQDLMEESEGVAGLHRNGDVAPWSELEPGGQFERLTHLDDAALAAKGGEHAE